MLDQIKKEFEKKPIIVVENKADIKKSKSNNFNISCESQEGIDELTDEILRLIKTEN